MGGYNNKTPILIKEKESKYVCQCVNCGKIFEKYKNGRITPPKYCSLYCRNNDTRVLNEKICEFCGERFKVKSYKKDVRFCSRKCARKFFGENMIPKHKHIGTDGYVYIKTDDGRYMKEHVYLIEQKIGRRLNKNECVHHKDYDRSNNNIQNLQLMTRSEHSSLHRKAEIEKLGHVKSNLAKCNKGRKRLNSAWNAKKVFCVETNTTYVSARKCAIALGSPNSSSHILNCCYGRQESYKGFHFKFID